MRTVEEQEALERKHRSMGTIIKVMAITLTMMFVATIAIYCVVEHDREQAAMALSAAVERIDQELMSTRGVDTLLSKCQSPSEGVSCFQDDYDVSYRGNRIPWSYVRVEYFRRQTDKRSYAAAIVHIERRPTAEVVRYDF